MKNWVAEGIASLMTLNYRMFDLKSNFKRYLIKDDEDGSGISGTDVSGESDLENVQFDEDGNKIKKKKKKKKKGKKGTT